ncbi:MAG: hypothetical protein FWG47_06390, partial [Propionibacteriaceae bacterium]|nr:hypothetical protein [Propionibacteriaceae bacterium]
GDVGMKAWMDWYGENPQTLATIWTQLPVQLDSTGEEISIEIDEAALRKFADPIQTANVELFIRASEATPAWRQAMVFTHKSNLFLKLFGHSYPFMDLVALEKVEPAAADTFNLELKYLDPRAIVQYQVEKALATYPEKKIWGGVSKADFADKMSGFNNTKDLASLDAWLTTSVNVKLAKDSKSPTSNLKKSWADNLAAHVDSYQLELLSQAPDTIEQAVQAREQAVDQAVEQLSKRVVKEQKRPDTKRLVAGGSGVSVTLKTGDNGDKHVTFFSWGTNKQVVSAFIKSGKSLTFRVPAGSYRLVYATGDTWYGSDYSFGPKGNYREFKTDNSASGPMKVTLKGNYRYTISIAVSTASGDGIPSGSTDNPYAQ